LAYATVQAKGVLFPVYKLNISMTVAILCKFITIFFVWEPDVEASNYTKFIFCLTCEWCDVACQTA
jgi:hypothetical protein